MMMKKELGRIDEYKVCILYICMNMRIYMLIDLCICIYLNSYTDVYIHAYVHICIYVSKYDDEKRIRKN
jgi:hypothetical protein